MRMFRSIAAVAALVMVATMTSLAASPSTAAPSSDSFSAKTAAVAPVAKAAKPRHKMKSVRGVELRNGFAAVGKIKTLKKKTVFLQKAAKCNKPFRAYKKTRTSATGKFRIGFDGKVGNCFRVVAPATPRNAKTIKVIGYIVST